MCAVLLAAQRATLGKLLWHAGDARGAAVEMSAAVATCATRARAAGLRAPSAHCGGVLRRLRVSHGPSSEIVRTLEGILAEAAAAASAGCL